MLFCELWLTVADTCCILEILLSGDQMLALHESGWTDLVVRSASVFSWVLSICIPSTGRWGLLVVCCRCCSACVVLISEFRKTIPGDAAKEPTERTTKQTSPWHQGGDEGAERCGGGTREQLGGWPEGWADRHHGAAAETELWCRLGNFPAECGGLFDWMCQGTDALTVCCGVFYVFETFLCLFSVQETRLTTSGRKTSGLQEENTGMSVTNMMV